MKITLLAGTTTVALFALSMAGCGSGNGTLPNLHSPAAALPGAAAFTGRSFQSRVALRGTNAANLTLTPESNGTVTGTLAVVDTSRAAAPTRDALTSITSVSGTYNPATGTYTVAGTITVGGATYPVNITGALPGSSGEGGSVSLAYGGSTFVSLFMASGFLPSLPGFTPTPAPSPIAGPIPTPGPAPTPVAGITLLSNSSGSAGFVISNAVGANITTQQASPLLFIGGTYVQSPFSAAIRNVSIYPTFGGNNLNPPVTQHLSVLLYSRTGEQFAAGQTFPVASTAAQNSPDLTRFADVGYVENTSQTSTYEGVGGTVTITAVEGTKITFRVNAAAMAPLPGHAGAATGTFTLDAQMAYNTITLPGS